METHRVIIDTDAGIDDTHALVMALKSRNIVVEGMTTVFGNTRVQQSARNVLYILDLLGMSGIPVRQGAAKPLLGRDYEIGSMVHGDQGLGDFTIPGNFAAKPKDDNGIIWMVETVLKSPGQIEILALGPQTNVALAALIEPKFVQAVKRVIFMGGTIAGPGNVRPLSSANINNDPEAAYIVFHAGFPIVMVGLDVTRQARMLPRHWQRLRDANTELTRFLEQVTPFYIRAYEKLEPGLPGHPLHDMLVVAFLLRPDLFETQRMYVSVETHGTMTRGQTVADRRESSSAVPQMDVCMKATSEAIFELFLSIVAG